MSNDWYYIGMFLSFWTSSVFAIVRLISIWLPSKNRLLKNLAEINLTWSNHRGIILPKNFNPAEDIARYLFATFAKFCIYIATSWVGLFIALFEIYEMYAKHRYSYDAMMAYSKLNDSEIESHAEILNAVSVAFQKELKTPEKSEERKHMFAVLEDQQNKNKRSLNKTIDKATDEGAGPIDLFREDLERILLAAASDNSVWVASVEVAKQLNPFSIWESQYLTILLEHYVEKQLWIFSAALVRIVLFRLVDEAKYDMNVVETPITNKELQMFEVFLGLDKDSEIRQSYLDALARFEPETNEERAAFMIFTYKAILKLGGTCPKAIIKPKAAAG